MARSQTPAPSCGTPPVLAQLVRRFEAAHQHLFLLTVSTESAPWVNEDRIRIEPLGNGMHRVWVRYGFMEDPVVPSAVLHAIREAGIRVDRDEVVYLLGRESFIQTDRGRMSGWREILFAFLVRNAQDPTIYFHLPAAQVVELGSRVEL